MKTVVARKYTGQDLDAVSGAEARGNQFWYLIITTNIISNGSLAEKKDTRKI